MPEAMYLLRGENDEEETPMIRSRLSKQRLAALFLLGCIWFNYPVLSIFDKSASIFGIPVLYAWLMGAWLTLIVLMAWVTEGAKD